MYSEVHKSGMKQFFFAIAAAALLGFISLVVKFFSQPLPLVGDIVNVALFVVFVYHIFVHYSAVFEYTIDGGKVIINRRIGHRGKTVIVKTAHIKRVTAKRISGVKTDRLCNAVFVCKNPVYIDYGSRAVLIDASEEFCEQLKKTMNGDKKWQR